MKPVTGKRAGKLPLPTIDSDPEETMPYHFTESGELVESDKSHAQVRRERIRRARERGTHTDEEFQHLVNETGGICPRCGRKADGLQKDHIVPLYQGGSDGIDNLQPLCKACNASKGAESINWLEREGYADE